MDKRKSRSLNGKLYSHALLKDQAWLQSEKLPRYLPFFVRQDLLGGLASNSNHLVIGRRGTGKTHLFGAFKEKVNENLQDGQIAVMLSAIDFTSTPSDFLDESIDFSRAKYSRILFKEFLNVFSDKFVTVIDDYITKKKTDLSKFTIGSVEEKEIQILCEIDIGSPVTESVTYKKIMHSSDATNRAMGADAEGKLSVLSGITASVTGKAGSKRTLEGKDETIEEVHAHTQTRLYNIKTRITEILELLDIEILYILIDEWMELDKNLHLGIQPYFAQLLKMSFFNERLFSVKIASVWHKTDLYDQLDLDKSKGLELGDDIELGVDLDTAFISEEEKILQFFEEMLFLRLKYKIPELSEYERGDSIDEQFIVDLFGNRNNFKTLIAASHGIPRKFWHFFQKCAGKIKHNFEEYELSRQIICAVARDTYVVEKRKNIQSGSPAQKLWVEINKYMEKTGNRHFVSRNGDVKASAPLRKLIDEELVHQIPSAMTPRDIRDTHKAFVIDYGNYIDWLESRQIEVEEALDYEITPKFNEERNCKLENYIIDPSLLQNKSKLCKNCKHKIDERHPVFIKWKACPTCAEPVNEQLTHGSSGPHTAPSTSE